MTSARIWTGRWARLTGWASARGCPVAGVVCEVGSGRNGQTAKLRRVLSDPCARVIVVEDRGRVARFRVGQVEAARGRRVVVAELGDTAGAVVRDLTWVLVGMGARRFGRGGMRNQALCVVGAAGNVGSGLAA